MIELLYTLAGIVAGATVYASLHRGASPSVKSPQVPDDQSPAEPAGAVEIQSVSDSLQSITSHVASSVGVHRAEIEHFNAVLIDAGVELPSHLSKAIVQVLSANRKMEAELADAQKQIEHQAKLIEKTSRQARTDALTGLPNRRALEEYLRDELAEATDKQLSGLLLMDIDHFKKFNDTFGHIVGDVVLTRFGGWLEEVCGDQCRPFRYGGEEFAVVVHADSMEEMVHLGAKIRRYVSEQVLEHNDVKHRVTASAGLCTLVSGESVESAYERADEGLYKSKEAGRNCGHWLDEDGWKPFPDGKLEGAAAAQEGPVEADDGSVGQAKHAQELAEDVAPTKQGSASDGTVEVVTLNAFMQRLEANLEQLHFADLPAGGIMVEAMEFDGDGQETLNPEQIWSQLEETVRPHLRGIDLMCHFRPQTLCIFLPGCSMDATINRAAAILEAFDRLQANDGTSTPFSRLAISVSIAKSMEQAADFLDRLEDALNAAEAAEPMQIVIHDGDSCIYRDV
ncbi:MAG: hypothetical protein KatS3mg111_2036 [Pirellulaceae bacterium]|nr:MAG: hypothetical protein KatS3mg111_2036 [Pirellulaceae bacterium]